MSPPQLAHSNSLDDQLAQQWTDMHHCTHRAKSREPWVQVDGSHRDIFEHVDSVNLSRWHP